MTRARARWPQAALAAAMLGACTAPLPVPVPVVASAAPPAAARFTGQMPIVAPAHPAPEVPAAAPTATPSTARPLAPAAAERPYPGKLAEALIGLAPGTMAAIAGKPAEEAYAELQRRSPQALAAMEQAAGGKDYLLGYLASVGTLLVLPVVSSLGPGGTDIVIYDRAAPTIRLPAGLDTPVEELTALPAIFDRYMYYTTNPTGIFELWRYDFRTQTVDTLRAVNGENNVIFPSVGLTKQLVAYVEVTPQGQRLRLYDAAHDRKLVPGPTEHEDCLVPRIDTLEQHVIYATPTKDGTTDIHVYDIGTATVATPPFLNSPFNELQPTYSLDGKQVAFVSDRRGSQDLYLADLQTGMVQPLVVANSCATETLPRFSGPNELVYLSNRSGVPRFYAYRLDLGTVQPLPLQEWLPPPRSTPSPAPAIAPPEICKPQGAGAW